MKTLNTLALTVLVLSSANSFAMGKKATYTLNQLEQKDDVLTLTLQDTAMASTQMSAKKLGCYNLVLGPNLASCLKSCNGKNAVELTGEPNYEDLIAEIHLKNLEDKRLRTVVPTEAVFLTTKALTRGLKIKDASKTPDANPCSPDALKLFKGDECLANTDLALRTAENPVDAYIETLRGHVKAAGTPAPLRTDKLLAKLDLLKGLFTAKKVEGFAQQGGLLVNNMKSAPVLLCQMAGRNLFNPTALDKSAEYKNRALRNAVQADLTELDDAIDFMKRLKQ